MSGAADLLYLEADDEITAVVRRVRGAGEARVVVVAPGRSRATSSLVALRLLARAGNDAGREVTVVGDALTRSLAAEAGLDAYASVEEARQAAPPVAVATAPHRAQIHVVRGGAALEDTALTLAAAALARSRVDRAAETRPVAVVPAPAAARSARPATRRALPLAVLLGTVGALLIVATVLGAMLLPAATITIASRSEPISPRPYDIAVPDAQRQSGTVTATATVTATGTYPIQVLASGTVVFRNYNTVTVEVPFQTPLGAAEQVFLTDATIIVPRGTLTLQGIVPGELPVDVTASDPGPASNVEAGAINAILNPTTDARLRGFPENNQPRVFNPEATAGGVDDTGVEITQEDVDAAVANLEAALDDAVSAELGDSGEAITVGATEEPQPVIEGRDGLAGTRDSEEAEIRGSLAYERLSADPGEVEEAAIERLRSELPDGHELEPGETLVEVEEARLEEGEMVVIVTVRGRSTIPVDPDQVLELVAGLPLDEARVALAPLGAAEIDLWPGWVTAVPELEWRIEVRVE